MSILPQRPGLRRPSARFRVDPTHRDHRDTPPSPEPVPTYQPSPTVADLAADLPPPVDSSAGLMSTRMEAGGRTYLIESWTDAQWATLPEALRPSDASRAWTGNGWFRLVRAEASTPATDPMEAEPTEPSARPCFLAMEREAREALEAARQGFAAQTVAEHDVDRLGDEAGQAGNRAASIRLEIIRRALELCEVDEVGIEDWHAGTAPIATVRDGHTLFVVSPADRVEYPTGVRGVALAPFCSLAIVRDPYSEDVRTTPEHDVHFHACLARIGARVVERDGKRDIEKIPPPAPVDDPRDVATVEQHRRGVVVRAARRWEVARSARAAAGSMPRLREQVNAGRCSNVLGDVQADLRAAELTLANALLRFVVPGVDPFSSCDEVGNHRPVAVAVGDALYVLADHPSIADGEDPAEEYHTPVVLRLERGRMVDLG